MERVLNEKESLLKAQKSKLTEMRILQKKEKENIQLEVSILKEHIDEIQKVNKDFSKNKEFLLGSSIFLLSHLIEINNYLISKNLAVQEQLKYTDPDSLSELDKDFVVTLQNEVKFTDNAISSVNQYYFNLTGEHFVKKLNDPTVVKTLLTSAMNLRIN